MTVRGDSGETIINGESHSTINLSRLYSCF
nr:MAG TPA: hypothetical protein [Bacteriophage sp.]